MVLTSQYNLTGGAVSTGRGRSGAQILQKGLQFLPVPDQIAGFELQSVLFGQQVDIDIGQLQTLAGRPVGGALAVGVVL